LYLDRAAELTHEVFTIGAGFAVIRIVLPGLKLTLPGIAEEISHLLVTRRAELDIALQNPDATGQYKDLSRQCSGILATIKRFFSLG
jgi:hypothetical protein